MATVDPDGATEGDGARSPHTAPVRPATLQQRFEESRGGKVVISVLVSVFVLVGVAWNLPESPIGQRLQDVVEPVAAATGLNQYWGMYGTPTHRLETVEVRVTMAGGEDRVWTMQPGGRNVGWWDRWILLKRAAMVDAGFRPQLAHWVVDQVVGPTERAAAVSVVLRTENLSAPGKTGGGRAPATKVLYQEVLGAPR